MDYLPITVQMQGRHCLIVGGGEVAARKLKHLLKAKSVISLVSLEFSEEILALAEQHQLELIHGAFTPDLIKNSYLVVAATDDRMVNRQVSIAAQKLNVWVNVVDDLELSTFIMPAVIDRSPLLIAVSSSGISPVLARKIREKIEWLLPLSLGSLLDKLKSLRPKIKKSFTDFKDKRGFSEWFIETALKDENQLNQSSKKLFESYEKQSSKAGKVYLIGAGPGAVDLLTVKGLKVIQKADVVLYDALVSQEILDNIRKDATLVYVGKRSSRHFVKQEKTNQLLVDYAQKGLSVVRLKGGDPMVFGRGGEELQYLTKYGINYEVVPGITAASGCASYAGIPLTHRDYAQSIRLVTAHEQDDENKVNWRSLAQDNQTLVFYMGLMQSEKISHLLVKNGLAFNTPVAVIEKGTTSEQRVVIGHLNELSEIIKDNSVAAPALIIVGNVVQLASELNWYHSGELIDTRTHYDQVANQEF
ncbi:siroheme synthase CysG [Aliikangiella sp. IMCC44359]|uniref:siroheme synthase CysG n=1 Tax=Aliikangiella sp. IMCC44359 TaxID=3459125 RepID=UPI00403AF95D